MRNVNGKVAVITGAGSGIGAALARQLAAANARLALSDVNADGLAETAAACERAGAQVRSYALDVADRAAVVEHADAVRADFGAVNLMVNNAGVALVGALEETSFEDLDWILGINFHGVINGSKAFLPHLIDSGDGHLVNISSVFGLIGVPTQSAYCAAKFGVRGFTESLRQEMRIAKHPVGVTCVHPGGIRTNIARSARQADGYRPAVGQDMGAAFDRIARTTPDAAARRILGAVRKNSARVLIGFDAVAIDGMPRALGSRYQQLVTSAVRLGLRRPDR
ncbi:SDR family NAD(P)-dependent oxidoreductase [Sciscionella marina]|uniref:SDR family NAD(P)-dependent oxidoreductase n=1 Tax=Sciscionella marina TaxID=508770 RepID=UPI000476843A|nr:SDR family NAD(P)-dependent oxidoreductase [Sciscionella marina]